MRSCPICGLEIAVQVAHCPACNADLALSEALTADLLGPAPSKPKLVAPPPAEPLGLRLRKAAISSFLWGLASAAVFAVIVGVAMQLAVSEPGEYNGLESGLDFGSLVGFMLGSIWGAVKSLDLNIVSAAGVGALLGVFECLHHHFTEWLLIAPPDIATYLIAVMGLGAGAITGACCSLLREFQVNR